MARILTKVLSSDMSSAAALLKLPDKPLMLNRRNHGVDSSYEEKCLESGDRGGFYHLPVLFESFDGRI
jgi:hypothetical protein